MRKIKKNDEVIVIAGKDKGRRGVVLAVLTNDKLLVEGINTVKKANPKSKGQGGITIKSMPIHCSNVMLYNPITQKGSRVGIRTLEDGRRVRYYKQTNELIDVNI